MTSLRVAYTAMLTLVLAACATPAPTPRHDPPTKGFPTTPDVRESVYLPVDRTAPPPAGYGLYTVVLTRAADGKTVRILSELFATTGSAEEAAIERENLNLIMIPVKSAPEATSAIASARKEPAAAANAISQFYDFNHAALLMASVCRPDRGAKVMKVCGSTAPDGPLLVTTLLPLDGKVAPNERMLIVNLSQTRPEAIGEVLAAYRRHISSRGIEGEGELEGWRLKLLNLTLDAAHLLPGISKVYAGS
jgi:hypothetical protein